MNRTSLLSLAVACVLGLSGCSSGGGSGTPSTSTKDLTPPAGGPKLEIEPFLARQVTITEKSRDAQKIVIEFKATEKDIDTGNYSYILYAPDGSRLDTSAFSIPAMKKDETRKFVIENSDLPKAGRVMVRIFGK